MMFIYHLLIIVEAECKADEMTEKENINIIANSKQIHRWTDNETKYLLDQYRVYFPQIGPFRNFKNKSAMFEQLRKDMYTKFNIQVSGQQCINRFKNALKQNKNAMLDNKVSGNIPHEVPYEDEFEEIKSIDDSLKPEVLVGVNHMKMNKNIEVNMDSIKSDTYDTSDSERQDYEKPRKRLKSNSLEQVLRDISATAEENRERRHKEKCELLISLLGKTTKDSE